ncbi:MAG: leucine-rich repeat domain-containing protein [Clostridia bacterium]|nr:leucine-rich repeat domain-containing protein [Clostridia bacterium]
MVSCIGQADENGVYVIPETISMISEGAFMGDTSLKEVVIGPNVKIIGSGAFQYCTSLKKVTLSEGLEIIGSHAFASCERLTEIVLPSTVDTINECAFSYCVSLKTISLEHIRRIGEAAFINCTALENIQFSSKLEKIENWVFSECSALKNISFDGVTELREIGDYVFSGCSMLRSVEIPEGVNRIGIYAFYNCTRLADISIPSSVAMVDFGALNYTRWYHQQDDAYLIVGDGVLIKTTVHPSELDLSGKGIKAIGARAFYNAAIANEPKNYGYSYATELKSITIPEGVREIGKSAFEGCFALEDIVLNKDLISIDQTAFNIMVEGIDTKAKVNFNDCKNLEYIGSYAFQGCKGLETVNLPQSIKTVGEYAFSSTGAYTNFMEKASKSENEADRYWISNGVLLAAYVAEGQTAIHVPEGVKIISGAVFCGWDSAYIPDDLTGLSAAGVTKYNISYHVKELYLPEGLEIIEDRAFYRLDSVKKVVLPSSLRVIGASAFGLCSSLSDISGGTGLEEVREAAFSYNTSLKQFKFSPNVKTIGASIFEGCTALKTVYFPENLETPGIMLFDSTCTSLNQVYFNEAVRPRIYFVLGSLSHEVHVDYYNQ